LLGFHSVEKTEKSRTTSLEPHVLQGGGSAEARISSSNRSSHAWQRYA
jgi:hypothetical protein